MATRIIVTNSTPLINFATIGELDLFRKLFNQVFIPESEARNFAEIQGLKYMGSIGCLTLAKSLGLIPKIKLLLDQMIDKARFWVSRKLYEFVLQNNREL